MYKSRDLHQLGILVKKMENSVIHSSHIDISYKGEKVKSFK